jgi:hypothetical protein
MVALDCQIASPDHKIACNSYKIGNSQVVEREGVQNWIVELYFCLRFSNLYLLQPFPYWKLVLGIKMFLYNCKGKVF